MASWSPDQAQTYKEAFYEFLRNCRIKSKEKGIIVLGDNLYDAQTRIIEAIFDGLGRDIHDFKILKSRQLGASTITRALSLFWNGMFEMTSALVFDTTQHLEDARQELRDMLAYMPQDYKFPRKSGDNRYSLSISNGSRINLLSAGVKKSKSVGALGAGSAIAMCHRSELCGYGDREALEAFRHTLARSNPNRLFIDESTARGPNLWHDIWTEALDDEDCVCIFCGWWSHPLQKIEEGHRDFEKYTKDPLTPEEKEKIRIVKEQYNHEITIEQLAWIRKEMRGGADDEDSDHVTDPLRIQEQPWTAEEAWQVTGSVFFANPDLNEQVKKWAQTRFSGFMFNCGFEFTDMRVYPAPNLRSTQFKVWEEPMEGSTYIVSCDPAYGSNENNDRSAIQVLRAYSDGLDQVAEYAWPLINTQQLAWVIAAIEAWYAGGSSTVYRIVEINGPGEATWRELMSLKQKVANSYFGNTLIERGLQDFQRNVKNYFYARSDSLHPGHMLHFKTNVQLKVAVMERLRDVAANGALRIRSHATIEEMRNVAREGDTIAASGGGKDDRVMALAMGVRSWEDRARRLLMSARRTREAEAAKRRLSLTDQVKLYNENQFAAFLAGKQNGRRQQNLALLRARRWGR